MYTGAIRKIFESNNCRDIASAQRQAYDCGYELMLFNGDIFMVTDGMSWIKTPLKLADFLTNNVI